MNKKINSCIQVREESSIRKIEESGKRLLSPEMCVYTNEDCTGFILDYYLPGVKKDVIELKISDESIFLGGETESVNYSSFYRLTCPIIPKEVEASYDNGLLRIRAPFKDIKLDMIDIDIK
ncbi:MAG: Hsp20/alpha crystallin family protein [Candidatus Lokiarchaeota archaeon]|nr:Hsp20/alpha crystallin family protein [Candidatus Lokiarchaeota archaeon]